MITFPSFWSSLQSLHLFSYRTFRFLQSILFSPSWLQGTQSLLVQSIGPQGLVLGSRSPSGVPADSATFTLYPVWDPNSISASCNLLANSPPLVLSTNITLLIGAPGPLPFLSFLPSGIFISPNFFLILFLAFLFLAFLTFFKPPRVMFSLFGPLFFFLLFPSSWKFSVLPWCRV